ncbi:hypothetical protein RU639_009839 [Aspergillus parasiticus]
MEPAHVSVIPKLGRVTVVGQELQNNITGLDDVSLTPQGRYREAQHDAALKIIVDEILAAGNIDAEIIISTTTVHPTTSQEVSGKVAQKNATFISAPVFGSSLMAEERRILIVLAGDLSGIKKLASYLKGVIARETITVSDKSEKVALLKIIGNFIISGFTEIIGEAHMFWRKRTRWAMKLLKVIICYREVKTPDPISVLVTEIEQDHLKRANTYPEQEGRPFGSSAMYGIIRQDAGLDFENDFVKERDAQ